MRPKYVDKFIIILIFILLLFVLLLNTFIDRSSRERQNSEIYKSQQYIEEIAKMIEYQSKGDLLETLKMDMTLRTNLNRILQTFLTKQYSYIFLLYKDSKKNYRFVLDGSKEMAEAFDTPFFPKSTQFDEVYSKQEMQIIRQTDGVEDIWLSLVYPIIVNDETKALLVLDLSSEYAEYLEDFNSPLMSVVSFMQWILILSLILLSYMAYNYYRLREVLIYDTLTRAYTKFYLNEFVMNNTLDLYDAILLDIDSFKMINTEYGESFGDKVLQIFVKRMLDTLADKSQIIRQDGTEFFILIPKDTKALNDSATALYNNLKDKAYIVDGEQISLSISMCGMKIPEFSQSIQMIQHLLDESLLKIKSQGKNKLLILQEISLSEIDYSHIDYIKEALAEERFTCVYQPIYASNSKVIIKYEALVRMLDKEDPQKLISPAYFLKTIQGTSQYIKLSKIVLKQVFSTLKKYPNIEVSMNLDLDDLYHEEMMRLIGEHLRSYQKVAKRLTFEILEGHNIEDYDKVTNIFTQLKTYGSKVAIDDFGSGYANYSYLIRLQVDFIKIDGSLIKDLLTHPREGKVVISSINNLAQELECEVIAEFVSEEAIFNLLKEIGIKYVQGYYLGKPERIENYLE